MILWEMGGWGGGWSERKESEGRGKRAVARLSVCVWGEDVRGVGGLGGGGCALL